MEIDFCIFIIVGFDIINPTIINIRPNKAVEIDIESMKLFL